MVNCCSKDIPNMWAKGGIKYLALPWTDDDDCVLFDDDPEIAENIFNFVEEGLAEGANVIVHCMNGQSRSGAALACYLMRKYRWSASKCIEFISYRRANFHMRESFVDQLESHQQMQSLMGIDAKSETFDECSFNEEEDGPELVAAELTLHNTIVNARMA